MHICVYGAASPSIAPVFIEQGEALGRAMVQHSHDLVFGGGALGLMGAVIIFTVLKFSMWKKREKK